MARIWEEVENIAYLIRSKNKDGLEWWGKLKIVIATITLENTEQMHWKNLESLVHLYDKFREMGMRGEEGEEGIENWERDHFILQHARIAKKNPNLTPTRLLQVAYNAGQLRAVWDTVSEEVKQIYRDRKLGKIDTYMRAEGVSALIEAVPANVYQELERLRFELFSD